MSVCAPVCDQSLPLQNGDQSFPPMLVACLFPAVFPVRGKGSPPGPRRSAAHRPDAHTPCRAALLAQAAWTLGPQPPSSRSLPPTGGHLPRRPSGPQGLHLAAPGGVSGLAGQQWRLKGGRSNGSRGPRTRRGGLTRVWDERMSLGRHVSGRPRRCACLCPVSAMGPASPALPCA